MMGQYQRDLILRMIEAVATAIAAAMGRKKSGDTEGALALIREAEATLLGNTSGFARHADHRTAIDLVAEPAKVVAWIRLLMARSEVLSGSDDRGAEATARRARGLALELRARSPLLSDDDALFIDSLVRKAQEGY
ncbi:MAG: hypothetical protein ACT4OZ_15765 [Gemmatimonadota bacterium]